jgi:hypothetical protein
MSFEELQIVVLERDLPEHALRRGDLGTIVALHAPGGITVEFVAASGRTQAVVTLAASDVRNVGDGDLIAVRKLERPA